LKRKSTECLEVVGAGVTYVGWRKYRPYFWKTARGAQRMVKHINEELAKQFEGKVMVIPKAQVQPKQDAAGRGAGGRQGKDEAAGTIRAAPKEPALKQAALLQKSDSVSSGATASTAATLGTENEPLLAQPTLFLTPEEAEAHKKEELDAGRGNAFEYVPEEESYRIEKALLP
jgi:hypothetical protein